MVFSRSLLWVTACAFKIISTSVIFWQFGGRAHEFRRVYFWLENAVSDETSDTKKMRRVLWEYFVLSEYFCLFISAAPALTRDADYKELLEGKKGRGYKALKIRNTTKKRILIETEGEELEQERK